MITLTERAADEIRRLLADVHALPEHAPRLFEDERKTIGMTLAAPRNSDTLVGHGANVLLIVERGLSVKLGGAVLDLPEGAGRATHLVLRRANESATAAAAISLAPLLGPRAAAPARARGAAAHA